jgi:hypothetical protein
MPIILPTQEAEIRRIAVQSQPRQIGCKTLSQKIFNKNRARVAQGEGPEFKFQYHKKKKKEGTAFGRQLGCKGSTFVNEITTL